LLLQYAHSLVNSLAEIDQENQYFLYAKKKLFDTKRVLPKFDNENFAVKRDRFSRGLSKTVGSVDLYHSPSPDIVNIKNAKIIVTVHDLVYKTFPEGHTEETLRLTDEQFSSFLPIVSKVICSSKNTRADLHNHFDIEESKTCSIDQGIDQKVFYKIEEKITDKTRAIMPVHLMGKPAEMDTILALAKKYNLHVIEDSAEAHGAEYKGRKIGSMGDMAAFSLYAAHIVTTIEGGIVITDNHDMAEALRSLRNHGMVGKFSAQRIGFSAKMNEIEAAVGIGNIEIFNQILEKRRRNLLYLIDKFEKYEEFFIITKEEEGEKIGPHAFSIILREGVGFTKDEFVDHLDRSGVDSRNLFYSIPTQCPSYEFLGHKLGEFPEAEYCSIHGTHIGIHQDVEQEGLDLVDSVVGEFLRSKNKI